MQQIELHAGPVGRLSRRDILAALAAAAITLLLAPVIGLMLLLVG
ncbi:Twin-arginine translocation pathway signal [Rhodopseudomonas palustris HaA2]|uniref:Twin-arginine translocation pathway signal n=1 Tax=Rhodopseudomonas palustris (strain HaA2) TaxID=316058 RepID=Q2IUC2_RHOP2|nr:twin-arginine translocation signal domain-containing protein [Rhodopseudomonas palustris]ABD08188.1 Twin-arginine translocation pathway signal [Rhodopseudomonas palustris HaA2]